MHNLRLYMNSMFCLRTGRECVALMAILWSCQYFQTGNRSGPAHLVHRKNALAFRPPEARAPRGLSALAAQPGNAG